VTLGKDATWNLPIPTQVGSGTSALKLLPQSPASTPYIPAFSEYRGALDIELPLDLKQAGCFTLQRDGELIAVLGVNHDRRESNPAPFTSQEWNDELNEAGWDNASVWEATEATVSSLVTRFEMGKPHWQRMLMLALIALLIEILLLRPWKKTS
jgi:3',5'-cyclic AMP phosphodiesterase CpdA